MSRTKLERGFYPISYTDIRRMIGYCDTWGYGNKDTCKYVSENIIERLTLEYPDLDIKPSLSSDLVSITHDMNSGANVKGKQLLISIK